MPDPLNAVVDISHHNGNIDLQQAKADGIIGVIHKATQGTTGLDPMYQTNRAKAAAAGRDVRQATARRRVLVSILES